MSPPATQHRRALLLSLLLLFFIPSLSWKKEEFRSCAQTPFCSRARGRLPHSLPSNVSVSGPLVAAADGAVTARLVSASLPRPLLLRISAYRPGFVRLEIDEDYDDKGSPYLSHRRFRVPDVVVPELEQRRIYLASPSQAANGASSLSVSEEIDVVIEHDPFRLTVRRSRTGEIVLAFNSHGLFDFEGLLAEKPEGQESWAENFRSHTDSRPRGPQSISFDVSFYDADFVYGLPEHASSALELRATRGPGVDESEPYRLFNLDVFEYLDESPFGLYGSIPFMIAHGTKVSSGFFWLNSAEMQVDVLAQGWDNPASPVSRQIDTFWMAEAGVVDAFFFVGDDTKEVIGQYVSVTGAPSMPQLFATAYHQCRWNYRDEEDVAGVDASFDEYDIPYDVLWLDIEHTDSKKYFTWDNALFPNPEEMQRKLWSKGRRMVTIVDPHIKRDNSYYIHKEASEKGYYVKDASGKDFDGWCWSGSSSYVDMLNPEIRDWWAGKFSLESYKGSTPSLYIWNDMNEPSVFNGPEISMPRDALHYGGVEHRELHNAYGYFFHMASSNGLVKRGEGKDRPFVLSRAFFAGTQRYGAVWTGDNTADWNHLRASVPMVLTLGLTGLTFSGADVGGFFGNPEPELLVRWYQLGAYYPFFRAHAHHDTKRREPWLFGEQKTALIREAVHIRYSLLPYFYTLFKEASVSGIPVMRPIWLEYPQERETFNISEAFMVGPSLLVQGVFEAGKTSLSVYLPGKEPWYDLRTAVPYAGGQSHKFAIAEDFIPSFQKAGSIIPRKDRFRRSSTQMVNDPYTLIVALDSSQAAEGYLYVDDGQSYDFEQGAFIHRHFVFKDGQLSSTNAAPSNHGRKEFLTDCVVERIILLGLTSGAKKAIVEPGNVEVDIEAGPLRLRSSSSPIAATIRRPNVRIADDWTIRLA